MFGIFGTREQKYEALFIQRKINTGDHLRELEIPCVTLALPQKIIYAIRSLDICCKRVVNHMRRDEITAKFSYWPRSVEQKNKKRKLKVSLSFQITNVISYGYLLFPAICYQIRRYKTYDVRNDGERRLRSTAE